MERTRSSAGRNPFVMPDLEQQHWRLRAACRGLDTNDFYPAQGESSALVKRICGTCEVKADCLQYALDMDDVNGVWGGMAEGERKVLMRTRHRAA